MSAYLIMDITAHDQERYKLGNHLDVVPAIAARYRGRFRVRGGNMEVLEGSWRPQRLVMIEFPGMKDLLAFYHSEEYRPFRDIRQRSAESRILAVESLADS
ncbi:MAG: DUF1330 domain-containing protein [Gammaproteobacteria bacterium]|nr:DUF1330 domain-containing protein [Gammaproteobacteria bacterium]